MSNERELVVGPSVREEVTEEPAGARARGGRPPPPHGPPRGAPV